MGNLKFKSIAKVPNLATTPVPVVDPVGPVIVSSPAPSPLTKACISGTGTVLYKPSSTGRGFKRWAIDMWPSQHLAPEWAGCDPYTVYIEWGHESRSPKQKTISFMIKYSAQKYMENATETKIKKGYRYSK